MTFLANRPLTIVFCAILVAGPFVVWLSIYCVSRNPSIDLRRFLPVLRALRWITWALAMALMLPAIVGDALHRVAVYGFALMSFSAGLSFSQSWLKRKLHLDSAAD